jgi:hypothetical protein
MGLHKNKQISIKLNLKRQLLGCWTGGCSTIQIKQELFDDLKSWDV